MKWILLTIVCLSLTSCSYLTKFYLFNTTNTTVAITYKIKRPEINKPFVSIPTVHKFKSLTRVKDDEIQIPITIATDSLTVRCTLPPKHALWIGTEVNFSLKSEFDSEELKQNLEILTITSTSDSISLFQETVLPYFETFNAEHVGISISETLQ